ncbi:hypothetical protein [Fusibacter sp. 3D3]|uniref:hypothetical protein n=1 Tax=Fusibacter sp. 3D3 TaxID=1048380 RepID=UPI0008537CC5|nr:hypothetical protein [Fusibacter sp. 3D3]GAU76552.1 hypothetical protein F3D3_1149 [Fusibacter sp. 3D3]
MRRFKRSILYMIIINTIIYMLLIAFLSYEAKQTTYDRLSNQLYFDNILILNNAQAINWDKKSYKEAHRVYVEINPYCRALIKDTSDWIPPMRSGYYPSANGEGLKAIVGKNIYNTKVIEKNGAHWIECLDQKFEVTGVVGTDYITSSDDVVILFGFNFDALNLLEKTIVVDTEDAKYADLISKDLAVENPEVSVHRGTIKGTARLTKSSYFYKLLYTETIFLAILTLILFGKYLHEQYKNTRQVYMLLGIPLFRVITYEAAEVFLANFISVTVSVFIGDSMRLFETNPLGALLKISANVTLFSCALILIFFFIDRIHDANKAHKEGWWLKNDTP